MYLFTIDSLNKDSGEIDMSSVGPLNYEISRNFNDVVYDDAKKVLNYTMSYDYELLNPQDHY